MVKDFTAGKVARTLLIIGLTLAAWITMTFTHETGHLIGGWVSGATLTACDLVPWRLPYSLHQPDPCPKLTLWGGPVFGVLTPVTIATIMRQRPVWFIADFCVLANGIYLAVGWYAGDRFLDTTRMLAEGVSPIMIAVYCLITIPVGYMRFRKDCIAILS